MAIDLVTVQFSSRSSADVFEGCYGKKYQIFFQVLCLDSDYTISFRFWHNLFDVRCCGCRDARIDCFISYSVVDDTQHLVCNASQSPDRKTTMFNFFSVTVSHL